MLFGTASETRSGTMGHRPRWRPLQLQPPVHVVNTAKCARYVGWRMVRRLEGTSALSPGDDVQVGLFVFSYGITMFLGAGLGLSPWDALHQGLSLHLPLSFGQASILVGGLLILVCLSLRVRPG